MIVSLTLFFSTLFTLFLLHIFSLFQPISIHLILFSESFRHLYLFPFNLKGRKETEVERNIKWE